MTEVRSCRKPETACRDQIPYLWLTVWQHPDLEGIPREVVKVNLGGNYIIYENWTQRRLVIHQMGCSQVAKHGGVSGTHPPNSWYC